MIRHEADFDYAIHLKRVVEVWQQEQMIGSGLIDKHSKESITIKGEQYVKAFCEIKVR